MIRYYESEVFSAVDFLAGPTTPIPAPTHARARLEAGGLIASLTRFTRWVNTLGAPAISLPWGFSEEGLPLAVQLIGPDISEAALYRIAHALEGESGGSGKSPTPWRGKAADRASRPRSSRFDVA